ncbi:rubredoxin-like domain-containing protein [uncultured Flavonifractor sp.]|uniref:rubredoxin-like domain-containing protein n=1 Tax=uncultured Flavonifractor sp. TaxID=1193534 RepID=UPI00342791DD
MGGLFWGPIGDGAALAPYKRFYSVKTLSPGGFIPPGPFQSGVPTRPGPGGAAPQVCPVCAHPQAYFEIRAVNY